MAFSHTEDARGLPGSFRWQIPGKIAGMGMPWIRWRPSDGLSGGSSDDLGALKEAGVTAIVSLTESPLDQEALGEADLEYRHIPITDGGAPKPDQIADFVRFAGNVIRRDGSVLVHCLGGSDRTGTMLACFLVAEGMSASAAIKDVRRLRPSAIENTTQEQAVHDYAKRVKSSGRRRGKKKGKKGRKG